MSTPLADRHCTPPAPGSKPLGAAEIEPWLAELPGWQVRDGDRLEKQYRFDNFVQAVDFVNQLTPIAEAEGHHPDLTVGWGRVGVSLSTHDVGGLSMSDLILAAKIDRLTAR